jgi:hypothetical protein
MASTLVRQVPTDDDGTGTVGTVLDAAYWAAHYNSIENTFALSTSFTPTWGNTGTANTLGNGSLAGSYFQIGKIVHFRMSFTWGSSTASGNGSWTFTIPVTADTANGLLGPVSGEAIDTGVNRYTVHVQGVSTTVYTPVSGNPETAVTSASPFTWANGDTLVVHGWYIAA